MCLVAGPQFKRTTCEGRRTEDEDELRPLSNHLRSYSRRHASTGRAALQGPLEMPSRMHSSIYESIPVWG